ncbi:hypothetical protein ACMFMF_004238 [Clarireedia jacksonii]
MVHYLRKEMNQEQFVQKILNHTDQNDQEVFEQEAVNIQEYPGWKDMQNPYEEEWRFSLADKTGNIEVQLELAGLVRSHFYAQGAGTGKYEDDPKSSKRLGIRLFSETHMFSEWLRFKPEPSIPSGLPAAMTLIEWLED